MTQSRPILWQDEAHEPQSAYREEAMSEHKSAPFTALYRHYVERIYAYCYRRTGNHADAEDLTGQVFTEALEKFDAYRHEGKAGAWLFTIAHSRLVDYYRKRSHRRHRPLAHEGDDPALFHDTQTPSPEGRLIDDEQRRHLFAMLDMLDEDKRDLILLRYGADLTFEEIGDIVGKSEAAVKMSLYRLLAELRRRWHLMDAREIVPEEENE